MPELNEVVDVTEVIEESIPYNQDVATEVTDIVTESVNELNVATVEDSIVDAVEETTNSGMSAGAVAGAVGVGLAAVAGLFVLNKKDKQKEKPFFFWNKKKAEVDNDDVIEISSDGVNPEDTIKTIVWLRDRTTDADLRNKLDQMLKDQVNN